MKELDRIAEEAGNKMADRWHSRSEDIAIIRSAIDRALALSREEIIEECAKVVEETVDVVREPWHAKKEWRYPFHRDIAAAIRALVHSTGVPSEQSASSKAGGTPD